MPNVMRKDGYRFFFFSKEGNESPHVHVEYGDGYVKCWLEPIRLAYSRGLIRRQLAKLLTLVEETQFYFIAYWHEYFS